MSTAAKKRVLLAIALTCLSSCPLSDRPPPVPGEDCAREGAQGTIVDSYPGGAHREEATYVNGFKEGRAITWDETGQKSAEGNFAHGRRQGDWTRWHDNGVVSWRGQYEHGQMIGVIRTWYASGAREWEGHFATPGFNERSTFWYENGVEKCEIVGEQGLVSHRKYWRDDGTLDAAKSGTYRHYEKVSD